MTQLELRFQAAPSPAPAAEASGRARLQARMQRALATPVRLVVTDNRRAMISTRRREVLLEVRVHRMFLDAPEPVIEELLCYLSDGDRRASAALGRFVEENQHRIEKQRRRILLRTRGRHHDLREIFDEVVAAHFPDPLAGVRITWGKMPPLSRRRRRSIRLGTYTHDHALVRIHPALDQAAVPRFFVAFVVFHELLHHVVPARCANGRVDYHPPAFRARERAHPDYERAIEWEKIHIDALLAFRG